jgi:hypothetical protein
MIERQMQASSVVDLIGEVRKMCDDLLEALVVA